MSGTEAGLLGQGTEGSSSEVVTVTSEPVEMGSSGSVARDDTSLVAGEG